MIDRAERVGLGVAGAGHLLLLGALSLSLFSTARLPPSTSTPLDVVLVDEIGLETSVPEPATEAPAPAEAPEIGAPEEAPAPEPEPAPVAPAPTPARPKPAETPAPPKPAEKPARQPEAKPRPQPKAERSERQADRKAAAASTRAGQRQAGSRLGPNFLKSLSDSSEGTAKAPRAAAISATALSGLAAAIKRQVQPCYELGSLAGTPAMEIVTVLRLRFNEDGSVRGAPEIVEQSGVGGGNRSYARQMAELSRRAVLRCAPLRLPAQLYRGGWEDIDLGFIPTQMN